MRRRARRSRVFKPPLAIGAMRGTPVAPAAAARTFQPEFLMNNLHTVTASLCLAFAVSLAPSTALAQSAGYTSAGTPVAVSTEPRILPGSTTTATTEPAFYNRLRVGTLVEFDKTTATVGEAMTSLLAPVNFRLTQRTVDAALSASVWNRPVPPAAREAGVMTIEAAMLLLIGEDNRLVVDHVNRLVAVERAPRSVAAAATPVAAAPAQLPAATGVDPTAPSTCDPRPWPLNLRKHC
jgi:hypothetical protein